MEKFTIRDKDQKLLVSINYDNDVDQEDKEKLKKLISLAIELFDVKEKFLELLKLKVRGVNSGIPPKGVRNWNCNIDGHSDPDNSGLCIMCSKEL